MSYRGPARPTFSASLTISPAALATDVAVLTGSASKSVRIVRIVASGTQATGSLVLIKLIKRTALDTGGTAGTVATAAKHDSATANPTAVYTPYTANPTTLGAGATLRSQIISFPALGATVGEVVHIFTFGEGVGRPIYLNGVNESLAINLNGVTVTGGSLNFDIEWTEE